ncbi:MAG: RNA methyltransferase [Clostridia bacterium]|nr:RNA methyltransferase [Clostridia bacterium]MBN2883080.1 RNA methyltransferase [Clostridia bacterium]
MLRIVSKDNNKIKRLRSLAKKKVRIKENLFLIEGTKIVGEAMSSDFFIDTIVVSDSYIFSNEDSVNVYENAGCEVISVPDDIFTGISTLVSPQGVLAAVRMNERPPEDITNSRKPIVILDGISDPGNLGTIVRTADAFGFGGILFTKECVDIYNPKTIQATMGSILRVSHSYIKYEDIAQLKESGYTLYGFDLRGTALSNGFRFEGKCALVIGNESNGISELMRKVCDELIRIPMNGHAESLNASIAAGIAMFLAGDCGRI